MIQGATNDESEFSVSVHQVTAAGRGAPPDDLAAVLSDLQAAALSS
jgi:hypothetical protein